MVNNNYSLEMLMENNRLELNFNGKSHIKLNKDVTVFFEAMTCNNLEVSVDQILKCYSSEFAPSCCYEMFLHYVFIVLDHKKNIISIYRDETGFYNVYYTIENNCIYVGNNQFDIIAKRSDRRFNNFSICSYLSFEYIRDPHTFFRDVISVCRGEKCVIDIMCRKIENHFVKTIYSDYENIGGNNDPKNMKNEVIKAFQRRVSNHNIVLLSGGIDSTIAATVLKKHLGQSVEALTFHVLGADDERKYSRECSSNLNLKHTVVEIDPYSNFELIDFVGTSNFPYLGGLLYPSLFSALAKTDNNSVSVFAMQDTRLHTPHLSLYDVINLVLLRNKPVWRNLEKKVIEHMLPVLGDKVRSKFEGKLNIDDIYTYISNTKYHYHPNSSINNSLIGREFKDDLLGQLKKRIDIKKSNRELINQIIDVAWDWQYKDDISYMRSSIENNTPYVSQMPYYDYYFTKYSSGLPFWASIKKTIGRSGFNQKKVIIDKYILRQAFEADLSKQLVYRNKAVSVSNHLFLNGALKPYVENFFNNRLIGKSDLSTKLNLNEVYNMGINNNGKWEKGDYENVNEVINLLMLEIIAFKYKIKL